MGHILLTRQHDRVIIKEVDVAPLIQVLQILKQPFIQLFSSPELSQKLTQGTVKVVSPAVCQAEALTICSMLPYVAVKSILLSAVEYAFDSNVWKHGAEVKCFRLTHCCS